MGILTTRNVIPVIERTEKVKNLSKHHLAIEGTTPRDRLGSFELEIVKKRETIMAQSLEDKIIGLYSLGKSLRDISAYIKDT